ncbi:MAG: SUF system NifU family Fe-S cluster assembly protein [Candidatus Micrarchaeales archaeon]|jgi:SUF system FeS assembly protein, NifU family|uniref:SUF system FeS assembly protein, NifU family n=1 Tax=Candidatus Micrarchaeum acidiphilum ARMAN-2 TaxID=425595 RepID=C7DI52_MICA2|nr:MAG: SUF system FeS assembly protein, NifU family [Candidatus Micrarchaeum acidiphilum ARMAN-2]MCW6160875.1 SUF system NifU family Fe-S cluster assembly protein [Candidatus Micrarchaeales archaeon]
MSLDLYAEELISNYEHPHNKGKIDNPDAEMHEYNPVCGDDITIYIKVSDNKVKEVKFEGQGCAISMGTASMLTESIKGKSLSEISAMGFKDIVELIGVDPGPARLKCATISLKALQKAVQKIKH